MRISDILAAKGSTVLTIDCNKTVHNAIRSLVEYNIGALVVLNKSSKLVGIISERDILRETSKRCHLLKITKIKEVMTKHVIVADPNDCAEHTLNVMTKNRIRHLPISNGEKIVGIVSLGDVVKAQLDEQQFNNRYLEQYMFGN